MKTIQKCEYNMDTGCVEVNYTDGSMLSIDCEEIENNYAKTTIDCSELDWLIYNKPLEYVQLVLTGEIEAYVNGIQLHGLED